MDLYTQCMARYIDPNNCSVCTDSAHDMCRNSAYSTDKTCVAACPTYFYFTLYRTYASSSDYAVSNARYENYTKMLAANETYINGTDDAYTIR